MIILANDEVKRVIANHARFRLKGRDGSGLEMQRPCPAMTKGGSPSGGKGWKRWPRFESGSRHEGLTLDQAACFERSADADAPASRMVRSRLDALASHITCETILPDLSKARASDRN